MATFNAKLARRNHVLISNLVRNSTIVLLVSGLVTSPPIQVRLNYVHYEEIKNIQCKYLLVLDYHIPAGIFQTSIPDELCSRNLSLDRFS